MSSTPIDYVVRGARTLIGLLPGQAVLKPIADFIFGSTKVTTSSSFSLIQTGLSDKDRVDAAIIGLQVGIDISPTAFITDSPSIVVSVDSSTWYSNYTMCCLKSVMVTAIPTCPSAKKSGMWGICIMPYGDGKLPENLPYRRLTETPFSRFGAATRPISLSFTPTPRTPKCYGMIPIGERCIRIYVAFEDPQDGSEYTSEDFSCNLQISGAVSLCCREPALHSYSRTVEYKDSSSFYTVDGRCIPEHQLGTGVDLSEMVL